MAADIEIVAREILKTRERLNQLYVHHTGQDLQEIEKVMDRYVTFLSHQDRKRPPSIYQVIIIRGCVLFVPGIRSWMPTRHWSLVLSTRF